MRNCERQVFDPDAGKRLLFRTWRLHFSTWELQGISSQPPRGKTPSK